MCNSTPLRVMSPAPRPPVSGGAESVEGLTLARRGELGKSWSWRSMFITLLDGHMAIDGPSPWSTECLKTTVPTKRFLFPSLSTRTFTRLSLCFACFWLSELIMPLPGWTSTTKHYPSNQVFLPLPQRLLWTAISSYSSLTIWILWPPHVCSRKFGT